MKRAKVAILAGEPDRGPTAEDGAAAYQQSFTVAQRRRSGAIYTPSYLAEFVLDLAGYVAGGEKDLESCRVLDPACGCGVFLGAAVARIADHLERLGHRLTSPGGAERLISIAERNLFGVDKDRTAAELTVAVVQESVRRVVGPVPLPSRFFAKNVRVADFLDAPPVDGLFGQPSKEVFDLIVGNPPYVTTTRLSSKEKKLLRRRFTTAHGRIDLYALFFERSLEILGPSGTLAFITPDKLFTSESARPLRRLLLENAALERVARFRSHRVFRDAATVPCVSVLARAPRPSAVEHLECASKESAKRVSVTRRFAVASPRPGGAPWHFVEPELASLIEHLRDGHPVLGQLARRISAGIATGRDRVFVVPATVAAELEPDLLHRAVRGQDIRPHAVADSGLRVIVPYRSDGAEPPRLVDIEKYPRTHEYLLQHRAELSKRHCVRAWGKRWYDLHDPWTFDLGATPKVVFPDVANSNRFAFDPGERLPLHSAYYMILDGVDEEVVAALMNSYPVELMIRMFAPVVKDGFSRYRKQFLTSVPVPVLDRSTREDLVRFARAGAYYEVNELVARAFDLSSSQLRLIRDWVDAARTGAESSAHAAEAV